MKKVFIVILSYNGWGDTLDCLESLYYCTSTIVQNKMEIVIVNNGPDKNIQNDRVKIKIIQNEKNLGFAEGNNVGIKYALANGADEIMILNNDTTVDKNLVSELSKTMEEDPSIGIIGPKIYFAAGHEYHHGRYQENERGKVIWYAGGIMDWQNVIGLHRGVDEIDHGQYDSKEETDFVSGCCMMIRREVLEKIDLFVEKLCLFDPKYYLYYEDNDLCQRVKKAGFKILYEPKAYLWHKNAGSAGGSGSSLQDYYTTRNRLLFGMKYAPVKAKLALMRESVKLLIKGRKWQKRGVRDFYWQHFGKGSYQ